MNLWVLSLVLGTAVVVVVAILLLLILAQAREIRRRAAAIWEAGQDVAGNTVHIAGLAHVGHRLDRILGLAPGLLEQLGAILNHAERCSRCPRCIPEDRP